MARGVAGLRTGTKARVAGVSAAVAITALVVTAASARNHDLDRAPAARGAILYDGPLPDLTRAVIIANADGSRARWIAKGCCGSWSPDGRFIAFQKFVGEWQLWVVKATGGPPHLVARDADRYSWAPNGHALAYSSLHEEGIGRVNVDGSGRTFVTSGRGDFAPAWSPDGRSIAFIGGCTCPDGTLNAVDQDGRHERVVADDAFEPFAWSPDGAQIGFNRATGYPLREVQLVNADGSERRTLFRGTGVDRPEIAWAPDGSRLALGFGRTLIVRLDGAVQRRIDGVGGTPAWSPDGRRIAGIGAAVPWNRATPAGRARLDGADVFVIQFPTNRRLRLTGSWALGDYGSADWDPLARAAASLGGTPVDRRVPQRLGTTFVLAGRRTLAYVRRSRGGWVDARDCVISKNREGRFVAFGFGGRHDETRFKIGSARPDGTRRWDVVDAKSGKRLGLVRPRRAREWTIADASGRTVAKAHGPDGPAAALDVLAVSNSPCET